MTFDRESCPPRDVLIDAGSPGATAEARERVADHLITCTACSEEFRLLQALAPWAEEHAHLLGEDARLKASRSSDPLSSVPRVTPPEEREPLTRHKEREGFPPPLAKNPSELRWTRRSACGAKAGSRAEPISRGRR